MRRRFLVTVISVLTASMIFFVSCGDNDGDGDEPTATTDAKATVEPASDVVEVRLFEWTVDPAVERIAAGSISFTARNAGALDHELLVLRTDIAPASLPTLEDGSADLDDEGIETVAEFLDIGPGLSTSDDVELAPGSYVLICNLVDDLETGPQVHYELGMAAGFEVTK